MTNGAEHVSCRNPGCPNPVTPSTGSGRPRKYCSTDCRTAFHRTRGQRPAPDTTRHDDYVRQILDEAVERLEALRDLAHADRTELTEAALLRSHSLALLNGAAELGKDLSDLDAAIVQQARDRGMKVAEIGQARNISADKVSRDWPADSIDRRMQQRRYRPRPNRRLRPRINDWSVLDDCTFPPSFLTGEQPEPGSPPDRTDATEGPPPWSILRRLGACVKRTAVMPLSPGRRCDGSIRLFTSGAGRDTRTASGPLAPGRVRVSWGDDQSHQKSQRGWEPVIRSAYAASVCDRPPCRMASGQKAKCSAATSGASCSPTGGVTTLRRSVENPTAMTRAPKRCSQSRTTSENFGVSLS
nr:hypothetical protein [Streptosporangium nondiastaticum]